VLPPATGWKLARWQRTGAGIAFTGVSGGGTYGVLDTSRCLYGCPDGIPASEEHPCGFYALKQRSLSPRMPAGVVELHVGLAGVVREYEYGYRAGWQRVLEVLVPPACARCFGLADGLAPRLLQPVCNDCAGAIVPLAAVGDEIGAPARWMDGRPAERAAAVTARKEREHGIRPSVMRHAVLRGDLGLVEDAAARGDRTLDDVLAGLDEDLALPQIANVVAALEHLPRMRVLQILWRNEPLGRAVTEYARRCGRRPPFAVRR
jgi:hypothetical protein